MLMLSEIKMKIKIKRVSEMESSVYYYDNVYERKRRPVDGGKWEDKLRI